MISAHLSETTVFDFDKLNYFCESCFLFWRFSITFLSNGAFCVLAVKFIDFVKHASAVFNLRRKKTRERGFRFNDEKAFKSRAFHLLNNSPMM